MTRDYNGERGPVPCHSGSYDWYVLSALRETAERWADRRRRRRLWR